MTSACRGTPSNSTILRKLRRAAQEFPGGRAAWQGDAGCVYDVRRSDGGSLTAVYCHRQGAGAEPGASAQAHQGTLLGLLVGTETWTASLKDGKQQKQKCELRRFALLDIAGVNYFVGFEKLTCCYNPEQPTTIKPRECMERSFAAISDRNAASVNGAMGSLATKERRASVIASVRGESAASGSAAADDDDDGDGSGRRIYSRNRSSASAPAEAAPTAAPASNHLSSNTAGAVRATSSGISLGLVSFGTTKLDACSLSQILLALKENGIHKLPPAGCTTDEMRSLWARNERWQKFKLRGYPGWSGVHAPAASSAGASRRAEPLPVLSGNVCRGYRARVAAAAGAVSRTDGDTDVDDSVLASGPPSGHPDGEKQSDISSVIRHINLANPSAPFDTSSRASQRRAHVVRAADERAVVDQQMWERQRSAAAAALQASQEESARLRQ
eukprot:6197489-Pleurochrysis_carterae.AAC.2